MIVKVQGDIKVSFLMPNEAKDEELLDRAILAEKILNDMVHRELWNRIGGQIYVKLHVDQLSIGRDK